MINVSVFDNERSLTANKSITEIFSEIGHGVYDDKIQKLREFLANGNQVEADKIQRYLPTFTPSGTFNKWPTDECLQEYSQLIAVSINDLTNEQVEVAFHDATRLAYTFSCFRSATGTGLVILVQVKTAVPNHRFAYREFAEYYQQHLQVVVDHADSNICKLCTVSSDPNMYINIGSLVYSIENGTPFQDAENRGKTDAGAHSSMFQKTVEYTQDHISFIEGNKQRFVYRLARNCNRSGIPQECALQMILQDFNYDEAEVRSSIQEGYRNTEDFGKAAKWVQENSDADENTEDSGFKMINTPHFPDDVYQNLPALLIKGCENFQNSREKDLFLTGAITILSGCMPGVYGIYDQRKVYTNLFSFVIAPAASGKSALFFAKELAITHHRKKVKDSNEKKKQFQGELARYRTAAKDKKTGDDYTDVKRPAKPSFKMLYIPANSSSAAVISLLSQCEGTGIICETEADTMVNSFKQDWGGYSDLLRKAFHHEPITYSRKTDDEFVEVDNPRLSVALSGTPAQVQGLITSAEDGLFSRFLFYIFKIEPKWRNVSPANGVNLTEHFKNLSEEVSVLATALENSSTEIHLSAEQWRFINSKFELWLQQVNAFVGEDATSTIKRLALIMFRICMVLSAVRMVENGKVRETVLCEEVDFQTAFKLVEVYKEHAMLVFSALPKAKEVTIDKNLKRFLDALPDGKEFTRQEAVAIGLAKGIKERTVGKYLRQLLDNLIEQPVKYGPYCKKQ